MQDDLAIIRKVIDEHESIRRHVKLVGDSISDQEALPGLERVRADWVPGRLGTLAEKEDKLQQAIGFLDEGLQNHFAYEEKVLAPLLGELFMRALVLDHQEIRKEIDAAKSIVTEAKLEGLSREELLNKESHIQQVIKNMCYLIEEHAYKEETILEMLQKVLDKKAKDTS